MMNILKTSYHFLCSKKTCLALVVMGVACANLSGCKNTKESTEPVVADIGAYQMLVSDYQREVKKLSLADKEGLKTQVGREAFLDQLIDQQVLLEEAQRLKIDQDPAFRIYVEQFWKQAMIERLIMRKMKEAIAQLVPGDEELQMYVEDMKRMVKARIRVVTDEQVARKLLKDEALSYDEELKVKKDSGWHWFVYEEVEPAYRRFLFALNKDEKKLIYNYDLGWVLFEVKESKERVIESKEELYAKLETALKEERDLDVLEKWMKQLRAQTPVSVHKDVLEQVVVKE